MTPALKVTLVTGGAEGFKRICTKILPGDLEPSAIAILQAHHAVVSEDLWWISCPKGIHETAPACRIVWKQKKLANKTQSMSLHCVFVDLLTMPVGTVAVDRGHHTSFLSSSSSWHKVCETLQTKNAAHTVHKGKNTSNPTCEHLHMNAKNISETCLKQLCQPRSKKWNWKMLKQHWTKNCSLQCCWKHMSTAVGLIASSAWLDDSS